MLIAARDRPVHLTYCTNIHAADGWPAVFANLQRFGPALKRRFSPDAPFGLGLRLSARDARELADGHLNEFQAFLDREGLYVAVINGFPHGSFHGAVVKSDVYAPDWRENARVDYTIALAGLLARLLPLHLDGGVSTVPLSYKAWMRDASPGDWRTVVANVVRVTAELIRIRQNMGAFIHLDIEPEPDCVIETSAEMIEFFERKLLPQGAPLLRRVMGGSLQQAERALFDHVRVCFDCCHFAVEQEDPLEALDRLHRAGIQIGRVQLSAALQVDMPGDEAAAQPVADRLRRCSDSTYLHQVTRKGAGTLEHFPDLDVALKERRPGTWRVHFHVPLFATDYEGLVSTHGEVRRVLNVARDAPFTTHLEIETYTWDVLPKALKLDLLDSIAREYDWVLESFSGRPGR